MFPFRHKSNFKRKPSSGAPNSYKSRQKIRRAEAPVNKGLWKKDMKVSK